MPSINDKSGSEGFSLLELVIAMVITLILMGAATSLVASAFRVRTRENQKSDALADVQRGLNIMSREIANAGFNLNLNNNGIVAADSDATAIRVRANLNRFDTSVSADARRGIGLGLPGEDKGEDVKYFRNMAAGTEYLARYDEYTDSANKGTVLANRIDSLRIHYFDQRVTYTAAPEDTDISSPSVAEVNPALAKYVVIALSVTLEEVGTRGAPGYQPGRKLLLVSDVTLRNSGLSTY